MTRRAALLLVAGCSTSPGGGGAVVASGAPPSIPVASSDAAVPGDHAMIDLLRDLVRFLSSDVSVDDIARHIGPVANDPGGSQRVELSPSLSGIRAARVGRYRESGKPSLVELELAAPVTVAALHGAFGAYREARTDRGRPREIVFMPATEHTTWTVAVIARLPPGAQPIDPQVVTAVTLRRDPPVAPTP
jgi:hypothetical protein